MRVADIYLRWGVLGGRAHLVDCASFVISYFVDLVQWPTFGDSGRNPIGERLKPSDTVSVLKISTTKRFDDDNPWL